MIESAIGNLLDYGVRQGLIAPEDWVYVRNRIIEVLRIDSYDPAAETSDGSAPVDDLLAPLIDDAARRGLIVPDTLEQRDRWDSAVMGAFMPPPSVVAARFRRLHRTDPAAATDYFHQLSVAANHIRSGRAGRDIRWRQPTRYGPMEITINFAKPEKDPRDIAAAGIPHADRRYPANLLARDNEGYPGRADHPARHTLRLVPITLGGERWFLQYSPYQYYPQHAIVLSEANRPMTMDAATLVRLADFVDLLPHYFVGANADLPIVGGSILGQDHFQGGACEFAMDRATVGAAWDLGSVTAEVLDWPLSVLRLRGDRAAVLARATELLAAWRDYGDPDRGVVARTGDTGHNTITPIARRRQGDLVLTMCLRNNRTSAEHPGGIYHPHADIHPVKRENIGLIEAMGLAVLPGRLAAELDALASALVTGADLPERLAAHQPMLDDLRRSSPSDLAPEEAVAVARGAAGQYFVRGLEHCGVFGSDAVAGFTSLLGTLGWVRERG